MFPDDLFLHSSVQLSDCSFRRKPLAFAPDVLESLLRCRSLLGPMVRYLGTGHAGDSFGFPTWVAGVPSAVLQCTLSIIAYSSVVRMGFEM
jgi:hypothetical protein